MLAHDGFLLDPGVLQGTSYSKILVPFESLAPYPVLALLGEPGIGKTTAIKAAYAAVVKQTQGNADQALWRDLRAYGSDTEFLNDVFRHEIVQAWKAGTHHLHLFLDSLDEGRLRINNIAQILVAQLQACPIERLFLRISCRTAEWSAFLEEELEQLCKQNKVLQEAWGDGAMGVYELAPLRCQDAVEAAARSEVDPDAFLAEVDRLKVGPFASRPITLKFLLNTYRKQHTFPARRAQLYAQGCLLLCEETNESRTDSGLTGALSPQQRMMIAARIAAIIVFGNRYAVWRGTAAEDNPYEDDDVALPELSGGKETADSEQLAVTKAAIAETLDTGLFSSRGRARMGWAHQTYAEFLAAWYLVQHRMPTDQVLSLVVHPADPDTRLIPQLHETAAWLASLDSDVFRAIMELDPEVLLRSDVATAAAQDRARLVESFLDQHEQGQLLDTDRGRRGLYDRLNHPDLAAQLRPYIIAKNRSDGVRGVAIDIAEACQLTSLGGELADLALDASESMAQRINAAAAVTRIGDAQSKARLKPLVIDPAYADIEEELKGAALLALWPEHITAAELFAALTPPDEGVFSLYSGFFYGDHMGELQPADVPVALAWVEALAADLRDEYTYQRLVDSILERAWQCIEIPDVQEPLARLLLSRARHSYEIRVTGNDTIIEAVATDDERRHLLLRTLIRIFVSSDEDPRSIVRARLVLSRDVPWLLSQLAVDATPEPEQRVLARLCEAALAGNDRNSLEAIYETAQHNSVIAEQFAWLLKGIGIHSAQAESARAFYKLQQETVGDRHGPPLLDPPPIQRVVKRLDLFEHGDLDAWWRLIIELTLKPDSTHYRDETISDLTSLPGWNAADSATRTRILCAADVYLRERDPEIEHWLGQNTVDWPAYAAFRALRLLLNEDYAALHALPPEVWQKWAPITLAYIQVGAPDTRHEEQQRILVAIAYRQAPQEVLASLLALIDYENREFKFVRVTKYVEDCWDAGIADALVAKLGDSTLTPATVSHLLETLIKRNVPQARVFAEALLSAPIPTEGGEAEYALAVAQQLALWMADAGWPTIWPIMRDNADFGRELAERLAQRDHGTGEISLTQRLSTDQLADLYTHVTHYPSMVN